MTSPRYHRDGYAPFTGLSDQPIDIDPRCIAAVDGQIVHTSGAWFSVRESNDDIWRLLGLAREEQRRPGGLQAPGDQS